MNFVKQIEEQLRDLGTESRHKHPGVKEASERAILSLRLLQNKYVAAVRQATRSIGDGVTHTHDPNDHDHGTARAGVGGGSIRVSHPTTQMFQSQDILRPFLLAANYPNVGNRILQLSLDGIQTLLANRAVCKHDGVHVIRILYIQANVSAVAIYGKNGAYGSSQGVKSGAGAGATTLLGSMVENYMHIPSAGSVVNAGVGTISNLGNSLLSGFGFKSGIGASASGESDTLDSDMHVPPGNEQRDIVACTDDGHPSVYHSSRQQREVVVDSSSQHTLMSDKQRHGHAGVGYHQTKRSIGSAVHTSQRTVKEDEAISIRILQIMSMVVGSEDIELSEELLSQCMGICLVLGACSGSLSEPLPFLLNEDGGHILKKGNKGSGPASKLYGGQTTRKKDGPQGKSRGQNVSRAASTTLRQIISILFSRAADYSSVTCSWKEPVMEEKLDLDAKTLDVNDDHDKTSAIGLESSKGIDGIRLQSLAGKVLSDLCCLAEGKNICNGPVGQAIVGQQNKIIRPSQLMCLNLMDMLLEQRIDLFTASSISDNDHDAVSFKNILKETIFPLLTELLTNTVTSGLGLDADVESSNCENESSLNLILQLTTMAVSVLTRYGHERFLETQCLYLLMALVRPIKLATNLLRDSHEFEDGFVYDDQDTIDEMKHIMEHETEKRDFTSLIFLAASISIEALYSLVSNHFEYMLPVFILKENSNIEDVLLSSVINIVCDFTVVASSCKSSISKLVVAVGNIDGYEQENLLDYEDLNASAKTQGKYRDVFLREENFNVRKVQTFLMPNAKNTAEYDIGGAAWMGLNFIVYSWKSLQACNLSKEDKFGLMSGSFGPSLAVIQHFLRRCPASDSICRSSLAGYLSLSRALLPLYTDGDSRKEVILATLCKLTVPWSDSESRKLLRSNVMAISLLFEVMYFNADDIGSSWVTVLKCLSNLSKLNHLGSSVEKSFEFNLSRLGHFSTFLSDVSLKQMVSSLITLSPSEDENTSSLTGAAYSRTLYKTLLGKLQSAKLSTKPEDFLSIPFELIVLLFITLENFGRYQCFGEVVLWHFSSQACSHKSSPVRKFSLDAISHTVIAMLALDTEFANDIHPKCLIEPICIPIQSSTYVDSAELGLIKLKQIIEDGNNLTAAWPVIINTLTSVANSSHSVEDWSTCSSTAFACLKLIVDDFLNELPDQEHTRVALLDCCAAFCSSQYDINTSLTATGMLWSIADQDSSSTSVDYVLSKLAFLATDERVEVRNCVVNTLFSCIVGLGHDFISSQWEQIFTHTIFAVLDQVKEQGTLSDVKAHLQDKKSSERYKVSIHHSRDSSSKQWATTQVLTLRGIERILRLFFDQLHQISVESPKSENSHDLKYDTVDDDKNWFDVAWRLILEQCLSCSTLLGGRESLDLRLAGVELLILCCQTSSRRGFVAADVRVGTNMQVVNGALRSVRSASSGSSLIPSGMRSSKISEVQDIDPRLNERRLILFEDAFDCLMTLKSFLMDNEKEIKGDDYIDSVHLQVLTRLAQGLAQLYESCKGFELSPNYYDGEAETKFVELVAFIMNMARGGQRSKFLTQAQRPCLDLLKIMSLNGSSCALEVIVDTGKGIVMNQNQENDGDILQVEAAKLISEICSNKNVTVLIQKTRCGIVVNVDLPENDDGDLKRKDMPTNQNDHVVCNEKEHANAAKVSSFAATAPPAQQVETSRLRSSGPVEESSEKEQLKAINAELMRQVEKLQAQKERLEQELAVLSEGFAYIQ